jgi:hypothetical protein
MCALRVVVPWTIAVIACASLQATEPTISFEDCRQEIEAAQRCRQELRISQILDYSEGQGTLSFTVDEVDGVRFVRPVEISIIQVEPKVSYPLQFLMSVPFHPIEEVVVVQNDLPGIQKCVDDPEASDPTCGWAWDGGRRIPHSQGFCCNKGVDQLSDESWWRGEEAIDRRSTLTDSFSTAHCYRPGNVMFSGYRLGSPIVMDEIMVRIVVGQFSKEFTLTRSEPICRSFEGLHRLEVAGNLSLDVECRAEYEFGGDRPLPELGAFMLFVPSSSAEHAFMDDVVGHAMLVPADDVDPAGTECDKIGVGYGGFLHQSGREFVTPEQHLVVSRKDIARSGTTAGTKIDRGVVAERAVGPLAPRDTLCSSTKKGACLHEQLFDKHREDEETLSQNPQSPTRYLIRGLESFKDASIAIDEEKLDCRIEAMGRVEISIEIGAQILLASESLPSTIHYEDGPTAPKS